MPAVIAGVAAFIAAVFARRSSNESVTSSQPIDAELVDTADIFRDSRGGTITVAGWCVAVAASLAVRQWAGDQRGWIAAITDGEAWQQTLWPMTVFGLTLAVTTRCGWRSGTSRCWTAGILAAVAAYAVLPGGDGWQDLLPLHRPWAALVVASCLANAWGLERFARSGASRWCLLVLLAGMAVPALLGALSYAAPAEFTVSGIAATFACLVVMTLWDRFAKVPAALFTVIYPGSVMIATMTTTARFYTWEDHPAWLYGIGLFSPAILAVVDAPISAKSVRVRLPIAATLAVLLIFACVWKLVLGEPDQNW